MSEQSAGQTPQGNKGWGVLGFCIPLVGLILFLVWNKDRPKDAKYAGIGAIIGVIFYVVAYVLFFVIIFGIAFTFGEPVEAADPSLFPIA